MGEHSNETMLDTLRKPVNLYECVKLYFTHLIPPTCFDHSCGHLQGGALQRIGTSKCYRCLEPIHRQNIKF